MIKIDNEFSVDASPPEVWEVITQLEKYNDWNSFVSQCESSLVIGEAIKMRVHLFPFPIYQKETILEYNPGKLLVYGVNLPLGLLKSYRKHIVSSLEGGKTLYSSEFCLQGLLSPLVQFFMATRLNQGFNRMANELQSEILRRKSYRS